MSDPQDTHTSVLNEKLIYESPGGDSWYLCENPATNLPSVKHIANAASGGDVSYLEVRSFLATGRGPEHEALRHLIRHDHFATILIAYDTHTRREAAYHDLEETIQSLEIGRAHV